MKFKKFFGIILSVCLMVSLMSTVAFAADTDYSAGCTLTCDGIAVTETKTLPTYEFSTDFESFDDESTIYYIKMAVGESCVLSLLDSAGKEDTNVRAGYFAGDGDVSMDMSNGLTITATETGYAVYKVAGDNVSTFVYIEITDAGEDDGIVASGTCGEDLTWTPTAAGTLTITGSGGTGTNWMYSSEVPWDDYRDEIIEVSIGDGVTNIGSYAFGGCDNLASVEIPDSVTDIGTYAFYRCTGLKTVTIPSLVKNIGFGAFGECSGLTDVMIQNGVVSIDENAFAGCTGLTNIVIPDSVEEIGMCTFASCTGLEKVVLGKGVNYIATGAFIGCDKLTDVYYNGRKSDWKKVKSHLRRAV